MLTSAGFSSRGFLASMTIHERESKTDYDMHIQEN